MNRKVIKSILTKTHRKFVESIKDDAVKELVNKNSIITGGAIVSLLTGEEVNDYDYYFTDKETCLAVANYYANQFNSTHKGKNQVNVKDDREFVVRQCDPEPNGCKAQKSLERCKQKYGEVE